MGNAELLSSFTEKVDEFAKYREFIDKAQAQAEKFSAAVVERVVSTNTEKSEVVVGEIILLLTDMESVVLDLTGQKDEILAGRESSGAKLEELELRQAIGELTDEEFEKEAKELKTSVATIDEQVAVIDDELSGYSVQLERWTELGMAAGILSDDPVVEAEPEADVEIEVQVDDDDDDAISVEDSGENLVDDMGSVFDDVGDEDGIDIDVGDIDIVGGDDGALELEAEGVAEEPADEERKAVLLYQEGTAEEQIYPIAGDVLTLGRGRDNDVQVKNDSKVSRYHCKIYRRGPNFYIEDNKSANGTLVNGELITERRLFGGEEVIIGETFFRFRILD